MRQEIRGFREQFHAFADPASRVKSLSAIVQQRQSAPKKLSADHQAKLEGLKQQYLDAEAAFRVAFEQKDQQLQYLQGQLSAAQAKLSATTSSSLPAAICVQKDRIFK